MMESASLVGDDWRREHPPLLRRHTEEAPPTVGEIYGGGERRVVRAVSDDWWAAGRGGDSLTRRELRHTSPRHQLSSPSPTTAMMVRARRVAWLGCSAPGLQTEATPAAAKPTRRRVEVRPKSCVIPVSSLVASSEEAAPALCPKALPSESKKLEQEAASLTGINADPDLKSHETRSGNDNLNDLTRVIRSASSPNICSTSTHKQLSWTDNHCAHRNKQEVEPYDGLVIQKAPLLSPTAKKDLLTREAGDEADEEDNTSETQENRLHGYRPKNGSGFIPFSKLFTKPQRASPTRGPSRSSQGEPDLGVENTYQKFSELEKDIIKKTRSALKQRINSASKKRVSSGSKKKIQLNIVVNAGSESDETTAASAREGSEAAQPPPSPEDTTKKKQNRTEKLKEHELPQSSAKTRQGQTLPKKKPAAKTEQKITTNAVKKVKKKELATVMSEISPIPSDLEHDVLTSEHQRPLAEMSRLTRDSGNPHHSVHYNQQHDKYATNVQERYNKSVDQEESVVDGARGGLLRAIITDAAIYTPTIKTRKGKK